VSEEDLAAIETMAGKLTLRFGEDQETLVVPVLVAEVRRLQVVLAKLREPSQEVGP
jgi:hypothetical protein